MKKRRFFGIFAAFLSLILSLSFSTGCSMQSLAIMDEQQSPVSLQTEKIKYYSYLTGLETSQNSYALRPVSFFVEGDSGSIHGINTAEVLVEMPSDNYTTKFCVITTAYEAIERVGKITVAPSYMTSFISAFNAIQIYDSTDSVEAFNAFNASANQSGVFFRDSESSLLMASGKGITQSANQSGYQLKQGDSFTSPLAFSDTSSTATGVATTYLTVPYFDTLTVSFTYNDETKNYTRSQNGSIYKDANGQSLSYANILILFADTTTVSTHQGITVKPDTASGGDGYFINQGKHIKIKWSRDENGNLVLNDTNQNKLAATVGTVYIGILPVGNAQKMIIGT